MSALELVRDVPPVDVIDAELDAIEREFQAESTRRQHPRARFPLYTLDDLAKLPAPTQLIRGIIPANSLTFIVGEKGTLKTFLGLDLAAHLFTGLPWHGHAVDHPGVPVYVWSEGRTGIAPRVNAWCAHQRVDSIGVLFYPGRLVVNDANECRAFADAIEARTASRPPAIFVDTFQRNFVGNENSAEDASAFVRGADYLRERLETSVVAVHHKGHGEIDRGRGSSVLDAAADTVLFVTRDEERILVECQKQKDGPEFSPLAFEAVPVAGSLALKPSGVTSGALKGQRLQLLRVLHRDSTDEGLTYRSWHEQSGLASSSFNKARAWLSANALVASRRGRWHATDAGALALNSTHSTCTPR